MGLHNKNNNIKTIYSGRVVNLTLESIILPNGNKVDLEIIRHPGASAVVPMLDDSNVVMIKQFRYSAGGYIYEIPAGTLKQGEKPLQCAKRELAEETGYNAEKFKKIIKIYTSPGFCDEIITIYLATGLKPSKQKLDKDEVIQTNIIPLKKAIEMIKKGRIIDAKSIVGIQSTYLLKALGVGAPIYRSPNILFYNG